MFRRSERGGQRRRRGRSTSESARRSGATRAAAMMRGGRSGRVGVWLVCVSWPGRADGSDGDIFRYLGVSWLEDAH